MTREELETLVRLNQAELFRYLRYLGAWDQNLAEDLVQEAFLAAFRSLNPPLQAPARQQAAWLRGIARNIFLLHCRKRRRTPIQFDSTYVEQAERGWTQNFLREDDGFEYVAALRNCLKKLDIRQQEVLRMRYWKKVPRAEMAAFLKMSEDGVKSFLYRLRGMLRSCVKQNLARDTDEKPELVTVL